MKKIRTNKLLDRRQVLKVLGVSGAVAPLIPALDGWAAPKAARNRRWATRMS